MNPFVYPDSIKTGIAISSVLKGLYSTSRPDLQMAFRENAAIQIIENLSILLKEMYPRLHEGDLPNLEDMLNMMNDFSLVEEMCNQMKEIPELANKYRILIKYFENNFYADGKDLANTQQSVFTASAKLDNLLNSSFTWVENDIYLFPFLLYYYFTFISITLSFPLKSFIHFIFVYLSS